MLRSKTASFSLSVSSCVRGFESLPPLAAPADSGAVVPAPCGEVRPSEAAEVEFDPSDCGDCILPEAPEGLSWLESLPPAAPAAERAACVCAPAAVMSRTTAASFSSKASSSDLRPGAPFASAPVAPASDPMVGAPPAAVDAAALPGDPSLPVCLALEGAPAAEASFDCAAPDRFDCAAPAAGCADSDAAAWACWVEAESRFSLCL